MRSDPRLASDKYAEPTTLRTVTTTSDSSSQDGGTESGSPFSTAKLEDKDAGGLPDSPSYPWGGDSPVNRHRHRPATRSENRAGDEAAPERGTKRPRWELGLDQTDSESAQATCGARGKRGGVWRCLIDGSSS